MCRFLAKKTPRSCKFLEGRKKHQRKFTFQQYQNVKRGLGDWNCSHVLCMHFSLAVMQTNVCNSVRKTHRLTEQKLPPSPPWFCQLCWQLSRARWSILSLMEGKYLWFKGMLHIGIVLQQRLALSPGMQFIHNLTASNAVSKLSLTKY